MKEMDDIFKRLHDHEVEVPGDMWTRIQQAQAPEDVKKPFFTWFRFGAFLFTLFAISFISYSFIDKQEIQSHQKVSVTNASKLKHTQNHSNQDLRNLLLASNENILINSTENINSGSQTIVTNSEYSSNSNSTKGKYPLDQDKSINKRSTAIKTVVLQGQQNNTNIVAKSLINKENVLSAENVKTVSGSFLTGNTMEELKYETTMFDLSLPEYDKKCPKFGKSNTGSFSIEAFHASDLIIKSMQSKLNNSEHNEYIAARLSSETSRYSFSDGIKVKWHSNTGIAVGLGIERSQIRERFIYIDEDARKVSTIFLVDTLFNTDGTFSVTHDTMRIETTGKQSNSISNSYTSINLPINLGYQIEFNRWALALNGGIHINLLFSQKGRILGLDGKPAWIESGEKNELNVYQKKSGLKFDGSISIIYHLTDYLDIMAEPYFKLNTNSLTRDNYPIDHYYNTTGIRMGMRYNFGF